MKILFVTLGASILLAAGQASAQFVPPNVPPPAGALLDLAGTPMPVAGTFQQYTASFIPVGPTTSISFVMRNDPGYTYLDDVSVVDVTNPAGNLILNGGFEVDTVGQNTPMGWTYQNPFVAQFSGAVASPIANSGTNSYSDGSVQAYDEISQDISTTIGDTYQLSFFVTTDQPADVFRSVSDTGDDTSFGGISGNGIDVLAYATYPAPTLNDGTTSVPEPASMAILGLSMFGIGAVRRRKLAH